MLSGTSPSAVLSLSIFLSPSSDTTKITVTDWKIVPGRAVSAEHIRITEPRDGWGWKRPLVQKKSRFLCLQALYSGFLLLKRHRILTGLLK